MIKELWTALRPVIFAAAIGAVVGFVIRQFVGDPDAPVRHGNIVCQRVYEKPIPWIGVPSGWHEECR